MLRAAVFLVHLASPAPEVPAAAPANLSEGTAAPEVQRPTAPASDLSAGTAAPVAAPEVAPAPVVAPAPTVAPAPRVRVNRPKPGEGDIVAGPNLPPSDGLARYYRAPFTETVWPKVVGRDVLLVLGTGARACAKITRKTHDAVYFTHRKNGPQQAPLAAVTSIHENSWECNKDYDSTPSEWARSGAGGGLALSAIGAVMGVLHDADDPACVDGEMGEVKCGKKLIPHFAYTVVGVTTTTIGTPVVAAGGYSTSRDLRVKGKIWARATGWVLYSAGTLMNVLWIVGNFGKVEALDVRGLTAGAGLLGLGGSAFMAVDALSARQELTQLRKDDATPSNRPVAGRGLRFGMRPVGQAGQVHGVTLGLGGRF